MLPRQWGLRLRVALGRHRSSGQPHVLGFANRPQRSHGRGANHEACMAIVTRILCAYGSRVGCANQSVGARRPCLGAEPPRVSKSLSLHSMPFEPIATRPSMRSARRPRATAFSPCCIRPDPAPWRPPRLPIVRPALPAARCTAPQSEPAYLSPGGISVRFVLIIPGQSCASTICTDILLAVFSPMDWALLTLEVGSHSHCRVVMRRHGKGRVCIPKTSGSWAVVLAQRSAYTNEKSRTHGRHC